MNDAKIEKNIGGNDGGLWHEFPAWCCGVILPDG